MSNTLIRAPVIQVEVFINRTCTREITPAIGRDLSLYWFKPVDTSVSHLIHFVYTYILFSNSNI